MGLAAVTTRTDPGVYGHGEHLANLAAPTHASDDSGSTVAATTMPLWTQPWRHAYESIQIRAASTYANSLPRVVLELANPCRGMEKSKNLSSANTMRHTELRPDHDGWEGFSV